jgi:hypothetical protein
LYKVSFASRNMKVFVLLAVVLALATANQYKATVLSDSPVAYWRMLDPPSSPTQSNEVNPGEPLERVGTAVASGSRCPGEPVITFDADVNKYYRAPQSNNFSPPSGQHFSVEVWCYITGGVSEYRSPLTNRHNNPTYRGWNIYASSTNVWELWYGTGTWVIVQGPPVNNNQWTHVAFSHNGNTNQGAFYINGALVATQNSVLTPMGIDYLRVGVGGDYDASRAYPWIGHIADIAFYHAVVPQARWTAHISADACSTSAPPTPAPTQDPAVAAFCDSIATQCSDLNNECGNIRVGVGILIGSGTMSSQAGNNGVGEAVGSVTLTGGFVAVTATGTIGCSTPSSGCPNSPAGGTLGLSGFLLNGVPRHSLIARVGTGPWLYVGAESTIGGTGVVTFAFNDDNNAYADNWGSFDIKIHETNDAIADICDASALACDDMHADCLTKIASCPLQ